MRTFAYALLLLSSVLSAPSAQVDQEWVARHDGPDSYNDVPYTMTIDAAGNAYVAGTVSVTFGSDCATIKYNSAGVEQWRQTFNGGTHDVAFDITTDDLGNIYVAGSTQGFGADYLTIKYDASGAEQWARIYEGPIFEEDTATSIAVDFSGNVYVSGYSTGDGTSFDYATIKYSPEGDEVWLRRFDVGGGEDVVASLAVVSSGVVVTGRSNYDYTTIMYDFDGVQQWVRTYNGPANSSDTAGALKADDDDNVYVTGMSMGVGTNFDYATIKYDAAGTQLWVRRFDGPSTELARDYDYASSLAIDASGNVFVTGNSADDFATVKYDAAGNELWVQRYGPPASGDYAYGVAVDGLGNVYVTGYSYGDATTLYDYATVSYDPAGGTRWIQRYNGPGNFYDTPYSIAVHESGDVYVSGQSGGDGTGLDFATIKYSQETAGVLAPGETGVLGALRLQNEPNPFGPWTTIRFTIPPEAAQARAPTRLSIYDVAGKEVALLVNGALMAGDYQRDLDGRSLPSGVYYARLQAGGFSEGRLLIRLK